jgi:hypothetical protein
VNLHPPILIEDDDKDTGNENASQASEESDGDVIFVVENTANEEPDPDQVHEVHENEFETIVNEGAEGGAPDGQQPQVEQKKVRRMESSLAVDALLRM